MRACSIRKSNKSRSIVLLWYFEKKKKIFFAMKPGILSLCFASKQQLILLKLNGLTFGGWK